jgi:hypothetical protein
MTAGGWVFMLGSISAVLALVGWSYWKVLTLPPVRGESTVKPPPAGS